MGEDAVDSGGPRREFFRLLVEEGSTTYLQGKPTKLTFTSNTMACQVSNVLHTSYCFVRKVWNFYFQNSEIKILGTYVAMSVAQGGIGFPVLHPSVYNYIVSGKYIGVHIPDEDIPDPVICTLLEKVQFNVLSVHAHHF